MSQPFIGEIRMFGGNFAPAGWAFCDGSLQAIAENDALFTLIGTTYGGDGQSTFGLPDLQGRAPLHSGALSGVTYLPGQKVGVESVTISNNTMPIHTHPMLASTNTSSSPSPQDDVIGKSTQVDMFINAVPGTPLNGNAVTPVGGSQPHDNMQPYLCVSFIISLFGIFPHQ